MLNTKYMLLNLMVYIVCLYSISAMAPHTVL